MYLNFNFRVIIDKSIFNISHVDIDVFISIILNNFFAWSRRYNGIIINFSSLFHLLALAICFNVLKYSTTSPVIFSEYVWSFMTFDLV